MKKAYPTIVLLVLFLCSLILVCTFRSGYAETERIDVSGVISTDTTWGEGGSSYNLIGNIIVDSDVTLTIVAGTWIELNYNSLIINGSIQAESSTFRGGSIILTEHSSNWTEIDGTGCIIENCIVFSELRIQNSAYLCGNFITEEVSVGNDVGISNGVPVIFNNTIRGTGITIYWLASAKIFDNIIIDSPYYRPMNGIKLWTSTCDTNQTIISGNLIIDDNYGIVIQNWNGSTIGTPIIENNTIIDNLSYGILNSADSSPVIRYNNIFNNGYNIANEGIANIDATYNYWGTTETQRINQTIYDAKNNSEFGVVDFVPFLQTPNSEALTWINSTNDLGGGIKPNGLIKINYGDSQTFTITPGNGYRILDVLVNDTSVGAVNTYTIQDITGGTTIKVEAEPEPTSTPTTAPTTNPNNPTNQPTIKPATPTQKPTVLPSPTSTIPEFSMLFFILIIFLAALPAISFKKKLMC